MSAPTSAAKRPADDALLRTLFVGMVAAFMVYALGFAFLYVFPGSVGFWLNLACLAGSLLFVGGWLLAVKRGFRVGKPSTKQELRAKERARQEKEKQRALRMRRSR